MVYAALVLAWMAEFARSTRSAPQMLVSTKPGKRSARAEVEPVTVKQVDYLKALAAKASPERFEAEFAKTTKGTDIDPLAEGETPGRAVRRLSRAAARRLITALAGHP